MKKIIEGILPFVAIAFAVLGITEILDRSIYIPAIFIVLATSSLLESLEYKKKGRNTSFLVSIVVILFLYIVSFLYLAFTVILE